MIDFSFRWSKLESIIFFLTMPKKPAVKKTQKKREANKKNSIITACIVVAAAIAIAAIGMFCKQYIFTEEANVPEQSAITQVTDEGVTWLNQPQEILMEKDLFQPDWEGFGYTGEAPKTRYYKVGIDNGNDILIAILPAVDPSGERKIVMIHDQNKNEYRKLVWYSSTFDEIGQYYGPAYAKGIMGDDDRTTYHALSAPETLSIAKGDLKKASGMSGRFFFSSYAPSAQENNGTLAEFSPTPWGMLYSYVRESKNDSGTTTRIQQFVLKLADGEAVAYQSHLQFIADDNVLLATWNDGTVNKDAFTWNSLGGCGAPGYVAIIGNDEKKDLVPIGKTVTGEKLYGFSTLGNNTLKNYYSQLPEGKYYVYDANSGESRQIPITIEEYSAKRGVVVYEDSFGRFIVFVSQTYGTGAECGKPVIYLYPEKTTPVSVQVGAKIRISEPEYGTGWNVTAHPDGTLINADGKKYTSLFWEGLGHGQYPSVDSGFVVPQGSLKETLWNHTHKLGLNDTEANEFMDFWMPHMPTTPYVRLTWFGTRQMDELAPLTVTPKPDTSIRLFLDFAGLEKSQQLAPQALSAPQRKGFTLVEWGGLLRSGK